MLLVSGRVVYYGEAAVALRYFEALGTYVLWILLPCFIYSYSPCFM
jgi:hypothetical protein